MAHASRFGRGTRVALRRSNGGTTIRYFQFDCHVYEYAEKPLVLEDKTAKWRLSLSWMPVRPKEILVAPGTQLGRVKIHPADVVKVDHYGQSRFHCKADNDDA
jgi:hypothetical protein